MWPKVGCGCFSIQHQLTRGTLETRTDGVVTSIPAVDGSISAVDGVNETLGPSMGVLESDVRATLRPDRATAKGGPPLCPEDTTTRTLNIPMDAASSPNSTSGSETDVSGNKASVDWDTSGATSGNSDAASGNSDATSRNSDVTSDEYCAASSKSGASDVNGATSASDDVDGRLEGDASSTSGDDVGIRRSDGVEGVNDSRETLWGSERGRSGTCTGPEELARCCNCRKRVVGDLRRRRVDIKLAEL